ncbi:MAG TPA: GTP 3',8-cyclase MoaA, partial [Caulobacteraceae bacterium]|nr:GTP 3',8-cyclase MoaA [Caulobacteraceae bacterium]
MTPYDTASPQARPDARSRVLVDGFGRAVSYLRVSVTDR